MDAAFEHYMVEKKKAEMAIVQTGIDWLVLRPAALKDDAGTGRVDLGLAKVQTAITRDDVAATLVELLRAPNLNRLILEVSEGNVAISQAVQILRSL
jgi:uncharacterized protein YbjT (DUF2867 family)